MREYVFLLEYDRGVHPIRDFFIDHPEIVATTLDMSIASDGGWRIERVTGPEQDLDALESVYFDQHCNDCTYPTPECDATPSYQAIEQERTARTIYRHVTDMSYCSSLGYLAYETFGDGLVFDATQRGPHYEWRVLIPTDRDVDAFRRTLQEDLPEGVTLAVRRVGTPERWGRTNRPQYGTDLPYEQRQALEAAVRMGYYDHPRSATLGDLATDLDLPVTTLRYRLRRAEAWAATVALGEVGARPSTISADEFQQDGSVSTLVAPADEG
jgi:predicted DNA binding protein